jgi:uncharacterized protein
MTRKIVVAAILIGAVLGVARLRSHPPDTRLTGAYRFPDGRIVGVTPVDEDHYRVRDFSSGEVHTLAALDDDRFEARAGWATEGPVTATARFERNKLIWKSGSEARAERLSLPEKTARFRSGDVELYGRLILPAGPGPHPAIVLVHGSEKDAATVFSWEPWLLAPRGIAVLVFDKRGTGSSEGDFGMDFGQLADDVVAAVDWLRQQPEIDPQRIGLAGFSQGGWISPLAASRTDAVKFVLVGFGLVDSPAEEDRAETLAAIRKKGFGPAEVAKADELTHAVDEIVRSRFKDGWDRVAELKDRFEGEPWVEALGDGTAGSVMRYPGWALRIAGPWLMPRGLDRHWFYDSRPLLEKLDVPMLWLMGGDDVEAPNAVTLAFLRKLAAEGKPVRTILYPHADHGILLFKEDGKGERIYTRYAPGYFQDKVSWLQAQALAPRP